MSNPLNLPQLAIEYSLGDGERLSLASRNWIAQEFHDSVAQTLSSLMMFLNFIDAAQSRHHDTESVLKKLRLLCVQLRSNFDYATVNQLSLSDQVHEMLEELNQNVNWIAQLPGDEVQLTPRLQHELCSVIREGIHNIVKHANATFVFISICENEAFIELTLNDNGKGFDQTIVNAGCVGLKGILERASAMGGSAMIESELDHGTTLTLRMHSPELEESNARRLRGIYNEISTKLNSQLSKDISQLEECINSIEKNAHDVEKMQKAKSLVAKMTDGVREIIYALRGAPVSPLALDFIGATKN